MINKTKLNLQHMAACAFSKHVTKPIDVFYVVTKGWTLLGVKNVYIQPYGRRYNCGRVCCERGHQNDIPGG